MEYGVFIMKFSKRCLSNLKEDFSFFSLVLIPLNPPFLMSSISKKPINKERKMKHFMNSALYGLAPNQPASKALVRKTLTLPFNLFTKC